MGALGRGFFDRGAAHPIPQVVAGIAPTMATIGSDRYYAHVCAGDGTTVSCWGDNGYFELGHDRAIDETACQMPSVCCSYPNWCSALPVVVDGLSDVTAMSAGGDDTCFVTGKDRKIACFG